MPETGHRRRCERASWDWSKLAPVQPTHHQAPNWAKANTIMDKTVGKGWRRRV